MAGRTTDPPARPSARIADDRFPHVTVASAAELRQWLHEHGDQQEAVWLVTWKKVVPARYVSSEEVLDELVAAGWMDGTRRNMLRWVASAKRDDTRAGRVRRLAEDARAGVRTRTNG